MPSTSLYRIRPRFPPTVLPPHPLPCPTIGRPASAFTKKICYYIHEYILLPFSLWYMRRYKIESPQCIMALPFGLVLKRHYRVHEQEALAMNLAHAMDLPAPRCISFGSLGLGEIAVTSICDSILMTQVPGRPLDTFDEEELDWDIVIADLTRILARMRSFSSPFGEAVCGAAGGEVYGPLVPAWPLPRYANEDEFKAGLRGLLVDYDVESHKANRPNDTPEQIAERVAVYDAGRKALDSAFFELPRHAVVFTHGDLNDSNILIGPDGHVSGIIDWEAAGWLPEYWEFTILSQIPRNLWGQFMTTRVANGIYAPEVKGYQTLMPYVGHCIRY